MARPNNFGESLHRNRQHASRGEFPNLSGYGEGGENLRGGYRNFDREDARNTDRDYHASEDTDSQRGDRSDTHDEQTSQPTDRFGNDPFADSNQDDYQSFFPSDSAYDESDQRELGRSGNADAEYGSWLDKGERTRSLSRGYENQQQRGAPQDGNQRHESQPTQANHAQFSQSGGQGFRSGVEQRFDRSDRASGRYPGEKNYGSSRYGGSDYDRTDFSRPSQLSGPYAESAVARDRTRGNNPPSEVVDDRKRRDKVGDGKSIKP